MKEESPFSSFFPTESLATFHLRISSLPEKEKMTDELDELEKFLETEASAYERDEEVERVLKTFKLNPFELLALKYEATERYGPPCSLPYGFPMALL